MKTFNDYLEMAQDKNYFDKDFALSNIADKIISNYDNGGDPQGFFFFPVGGTEYSRKVSYELELLDDYTFEIKTPFGNESIDCKSPQILDKDRLVEALDKILS